MRCIFEICTLWKKEICNIEDIVELHRRKIDEGSLFKELGEGIIQKYNKICSECKFPLMIEERQCPVCENENLHFGITKGQCGVNLVFNYNCEECGRILYSYSKFG